MAGIGHVIANNIRAERARRRMTQADLAHTIGWPRSSIHDIEASRRKISPDDLVALCRAFGITLTELAHGADPDDLTTLGL
jgi:transcriptional regulator with XRE-family HTH domain